MSLFVIIVLYCFTGKTPVIKHDTGFKSIHQLQSEEHSKDTIIDTTIDTTRNGKRNFGKNTINHRRKALSTHLNPRILLIFTGILLLLFFVIIAIRRRKNK